MILSSPFRILESRRIHMAHEVALTFGGKIREGLLPVRGIIPSQAAKRTNEARARGEWDGRRELVIQDDQRRLSGFGQGRRSQFRPRLVCWATGLRPD